MNNNWYKKEKPLLGLTGLGGGVDGLSVVGAATKTYIEDVFSTYLYTGNDSSNTITTNIDSSSNDSLLWIKNRTSTVNNQLFDTVRGANKVLKSNTSDAQYDGTGAYNQTFTSTGFTLNNSYTNLNSNNNNFSSWTFRKAKGFFDIVTYTGNGSNRTISHSLGSVPGAIFVKNLSDGGEYWRVYHRGTGDGSPQNYEMYLNTNSAETSASSTWNQTAPTSSVFSLGTENGVNANGNNFVAYVFAGGASTAATARSVDFDGNGDYLTSNVSSDYTLGTSDFTLEYWYKPDVWSVAYLVDAVATDIWGTYHNASGIHKYIVAGTDRLVSTSALSIGSWHHIAVVRSSGTTRMYINGNQEGGTYSDSTNYSFTQLNIGAKTDGAGDFNGKISNFRLVVGTAVYTSSFRPPTEPLTSITNTKLLCCNNISATGSTTGTVNTGGGETASSDSPFDDPAGFKFGDSKEGIIKTGSYKGNSTANHEIYVGWEPQYWLVKNVTDGSSNWQLLDSMRGWVSDGNDEYLVPNNTSAEGSFNFGNPTPTGFNLSNASSNWQNESGKTYVYIAIRNTDGYVGKTVEAGTEVFVPINGNGWGACPPGSNVTNFVVDYMFQKNTSAGSAPGYTATRISGTKYVRMDHSATSSTSSDYGWDSNTGMGNAFSHPAWHWRRYSGFESMAFIGDGVISARPHNLGGTPEFMLFKNMDAGHDWMCWHKDLNGGVDVGQYFMVGNSTNAAGTSSDPFGNIAPTATHVTVGNGPQANGDGEQIIGMLFRSVSGISYVGSYIGNDSASGPSIDCGFQPRLLWIKNSSSTGNWMLYDSNRGFGKCYFTNTGDAEESATRLTVTSDGFDITSAASVINNNNDRFVFYAHA